MRKITCCRDSEWKGSPAFREYKTFCRMLLFSFTYFDIILRKEMAKISTKYFNVFQCRKNATISTFCDLCQFNDALSSTWVNECNRPISHFY